jgi:flagellar hook protein FlgE
MSAFNIGLSGLNSSSKDLDVTSNNIANAETVGFKKSRTEFSDVYATTVFGKTKTQAGSGVSVQAVTQQFNQGNLTFTENALDLGISGRGFFVLKPNLDNHDAIYTRAGAFQVNKEGYVTNAAGQYLQGFPVNPDGSVTATALASTIPILLPETSGAPEATTEVGLSVNLDAREAQPVDGTGAPLAFDHTDPETYNASTSVNVYDSVGSQHTVTYYFVKDAAATPQTWQVYTSIDGYTDQGASPKQPADDDPSDTSTVTITPGVIAFDNQGRYSEADSSVGNITWTGRAGVDDLDFDTDFGANTVTALSGSTQFSQAFSVQGLSQDGYAPGQLTGIDISENGIIFVNYSNGESTAIAKLALANFSNSQGLRQLGDTTWQESLDSGEALAGEAGTGVFGLIRSGALEQSNVDLTAELVHLIVAQRNFQANAKSIETASRITETIINVR